MHGPFGGELLHETGGSIERVPQELIGAFGGGSATMPRPEAIQGAAQIVTYTWDQASSTLTYGADLRGTSPIDEAPSLSRSAALAALADAAAALRSIHACGVAHGDIRPATVRVGSLGPLILVPGQRLGPGASLMARLRHGSATAAEVSFAAPEVVTGFEATEASDVYSLSALAHRLLSGFAPLGQIDFGVARHPASPLHELASYVAAGLSAAPANRPPLEALERGLRDAARLAGELDARANGGGPYRAGSQAPHDARSPAQASAMREGASSMSAILILVLIVGGFFVVVGAVWLVAVNWDALGELGRFALLGLLTAGIAASGVSVEQRGSQRSGFALLVIASQLLWADAAYLLHLLDVMDRPGPWALASAGVTSVTFALSASRRSSLAATLAALGFGVLGGCLGVFLSTGSELGPATWALVVALGFTAMASAGHFFGREGVGVPFSLGAIGCGWLSALLSLVLLGDEGHRLFGTVWPYAILGFSLPFALVGPATYRTMALVAASGLLGAVPSIEALVRHDAIAYMIWAIAMGQITICASFIVPWVSRDATRQHAGVLLGLASAVSSPSLLFLAKCGSRDGLDALRTPEGVYLIAVCVVPFLLLGLSYALSSRTARKSAYRLVELIALLQFFGLFTLESLLRYDDFFYPLILLAAAVLVLVAGVFTRRATLVLLAAVALLLNLWIQYFAKLRHAFPTSVLVLGFGLSLLVFGVLYERRVRHLLPRLESWA